MKKVAGPAVKLLVFFTVTAVCAVIIVAALRTPVGGPLSSYGAEFDDVSGLYVGDDVRMSGVQIGKVSSVELDGALARVEFEIEDRRPIFANTQAAVRYQNLLGQRYVELVQKDSATGAPLAVGATISKDRTIPSFDISKLFNGFEPIFDTLDTAQLNQFTENILRMVQGDGSGLGPVLRDVDRITQFAVQRESIIGLLIENLGQISDSIGGQSASVADLLEQLHGLVSKLSTQMDGVLASLDQANYGLRPFVGLMEGLERAYDNSYAPVDGALRRMLPQTEQVTEMLALAPGLLTGLNASIPDPGAQTYSCSRGQQDIPGIGQIVLGGQNLVVCR
ncbi:MULTISPECIES: MlaD family protein [Rhodococcus]|jgi:phospholipid/cholesterol/gamma-HCH transport system substrate-binding protein|uniref:MCE family protein n=2 Tax=Rhodococcus TaxID=1827 RepID=A0ABU4D4C8_9NOCA|nr:MULTISPECIES: MCE family protein [Rhodococcus]KAA0925203.1 MCE family protein [Rhodococcus sp. ANT_H53B]KZF08430.1 virulence factor Mce [Rhodococcus sp. EPR-147]KZF09945.1 virulence factor Mce [Rhodococcus sp. EPR-279]MDV6303961.1 MCE family protein [Rhodococcus cerastii]MDV7989511.1 MCE family protein [Rhodococcus sp. IEGM 1374]